MVSICRIDNFFDFTKGEIFSLSFRREDPSEIVQSVPHVAIEKAPTRGVFKEFLTIKKESISILGLLSIKIDEPVSLSIMKIWDVGLYMLGLLAYRKCRKTSI